VIDRARASAIGHGEMPFHNPISESTLDTLIRLLPLGPGDGVLDVGCGRGELLVRIAEVTAARGFGLDSSEALISRARHEASTRVPATEMTFETRDAGTLVAPAGSFALAACVGSSHALGGLEATLGRLTELVRPGGHILVGEGFWIRPPTYEELEVLGATQDELPDLTGLLAAGDSDGLRPVYLATATDEDWRRYEWGYVLNLESYAAANPDEPGIELLRDRAEAVRQRRLLAASHGESLGFALVVWQLPGVVGEHAAVDDEIRA
jgi:SAM-dependent methyltransferase